MASDDNEAARLPKDSPARKVKKQRIKKNQSRETLAPNATQPPDQSLLMSLPPELRNMVYEYVLLSDAARWQDEVASRVMEYGMRPGVTPEQRMQWHERLSDRAFGNLVKPGEYTQPGLLQVSKQIRGEVLPVFYDLNKFKIVVEIHQLTTVRSWLNSIKPQYHNLLPDQGMYTKLRLEMPPAMLKWHKIDQLLPLALIAMDHPDLNFRNDYWRSTYGEVFELGREVAREGWSEEWLAIRFDEWLQDQRNNLNLSRALYVKNRRIKVAALRKGAVKPILVRDPTTRLMGDTYATRSREGDDRDFVAAVRHLPTSDRKLRSMAKQ